jgi:hypothetical protein
MRKSIVAAATIAAVLSIGTPHKKRYGNAGRDAGPARSCRRSHGFRRKDSADLRAVGLPLAPLLGMVPALCVPVPLLGLAPPLLVGLASAPLVGLASTP